MFSQALMYYAHQLFQNGWAGEPGNNPMVETASTVTFEGMEMSPSNVMALAHDAVLADTAVEAGGTSRFKQSCFLA